MSTSSPDAGLSLGLVKFRRNPQNTEVTHRRRSFSRCSFVDKYSCSRQSRKALGRFHHADRENLHKDSDNHK